MLIADEPDDEIPCNPLNRMITSYRTTLLKIMTKYNIKFDVVFKISNPKVRSNVWIHKTHKSANKILPASIGLSVSVGEDE
jgi:hypothetical protein